MTDQRVQLEVLVEELSAERALAILLPKIVPGSFFVIRTFSGKQALLAKLSQRLYGYASRLSGERIKVVVLVDRDDEDCTQLKAKLEQLVDTAGLAKSPNQAGGTIVLNRIVVEELESWFLGDVPALRLAYPKVPAGLEKQAKFRDPDAVPGKTCRAFKTLLQKHGYHRAGLNKVQAAREIAPHMNVESNRSKSFQVCRDGVRRLVSEEPHA